MEVIWTVETSSDVVDRGSSIVTVEVVKKSVVVSGGGLENWVVVKSWNETVESDTVVSVTGKINVDEDAGGALWN